MTDPAIADPAALSELTQQQLQFWLGQKLQPGSSLYNQADSFAISTALDPAHFGHAFQTLVDRTDALRTVFEESDGVPRPKVLGAFPYRLNFVDVSAEADPPAACQAWVDQRARIPLDLERRLFDSALLKLADDQFTWYLNIHHIVSDGWTFALLFRRMAGLYRRSLEGRLDDAGPFPPFRDFVASERAYRETDQYLADKAYWEETLEQGVEPLTYYGRPAASGPAFVRRTARGLGAERTRQLKAIAGQPRFAGKTLNVALSNIFAGLFAAYLHRITGNERLSIGVPFMNRPSPAFRETAGLFMQVAPLRLAVGEADTLASLVEQAREASRRARAHGRYPLVNSRNALYDAILNFHNVSFKDFNGAPAEERWIHSGDDSSSLALHVRYPEAKSLLLHFDWHPDVFDEAQAERAVGHFLRVLDAFLENPGAPVGRVDLLTAEERERVLVAFNRTGQALPTDLCVHELFELQAGRTADAVAVICGGDRLTYGELNGRANRLAHHLRGLGVGPGTLVGICLERSADMVAGLLGILKAGGAYVPLNPDYPAERLATLLDDSRAPVVLTEERLAPALPDRGACEVLIDGDRERIAGRPAGNPDRSAGPEDLAYVIYTSGSTGRPKGVQIPHGAVVNFLEAMAREPGLSPHDTLLALTTLSFDIAGLEIFLPLAVGARLALVGRGTAADGAGLLRALAESGATVMQATPVSWRMLLDAGWEGDTRLKALCGGEALPPGVARDLLGRTASLWNVYGPTETTIWSTVHRVLPEEGPAPIGRPISNTRAYVVDRWGRPAPIGVSGELCIGGAGLARGYLNSPALTAEKFVPDPFGPVPGERLYRTGDLARHLPDGEIEWLGRTDFQVKLRGHRIEPGEIEAALRRHPAVAQAVVLGREDVPGERYLVAYVVPGGEPPPVASELRSFLKGKLPAHMVPSAFVWLDRLPLTANGKVDRQALRPPDPSRPESADGYVAPRNPTEERLAGIWSELLGLERVGIHDSFFDLAGHSLMATRVVSRVRDAFHVELPLRAFFDSPTIASLAGGIAAIDCAVAGGEERGTAGDHEEGVL